MLGIRNHVLKVGIAGYGIIGQRRRSVIDEHPNLQTIAVCDQKFDDSGIMPSGIKYYQSYQQLLEEQLDILFVCLPNYLAPEVTIAGLNKKLHVFCEKPPGRTIDDVKDVIEAEKKHPELVLKYGFNHRYHDSIQEAMALIRSGELGLIINMRGVYGKSKIVTFASGWRSERKFAGGGILLDQGIHLLDIMRLFCGEFVEVKSFVSNDFWKHDVEDNAYALMRDRKGRVAMLHSTATQWQHTFSLNIALTKGFIVLNGILSNSKSYGQEELIIGRRQESDIGSTREETRRYLTDNSWKLEVEEFASAILTNHEINHGKSTDALESMRLVYRIYWSDPEWQKSYGIKCPD